MESNNAIPYLKSRTIEQKSLNLLERYSKDTAKKVQLPIPVLDMIEYLGYDIDFRSYDKSDNSEETYPPAGPASPGNAFGKGVGIAFSKVSLKEILAWYASQDEEKAKTDESDRKKKLQEKSNLYNKRGSDYCRYYCRFLWLLARFSSYRIWYYSVVRRSG